MTKDEALKMAIKTCEFWIGGGDDELEKTINACKEALEQPSQEPVAWMMVHREPEHGAAYLTFDKPTREQKISHHPYELYTHPHQWQGLTDDEMEYACSKCDKEFSISAFKMGVIWAEQALKEKNT